MGDMKTVTKKKAKRLFPKTTKKIEEETAASKSRDQTGGTNEKRPAKRVASHEDEKNVTKSPVKKKRKPKKADVTVEEKQKTDSSSHTDGSVKLKHSVKRAFSQEGKKSISKGGKTKKARIAPEPDVEDDNSDGRRQKPKLAKDAHVSNADNQTSSGKTKQKTPTSNSDTKKPLKRPLTEEGEKSVTKGKTKKSKTLLNLSVEDYDSSDKKKQPKPEKKTKHAEAADVPQIKHLSSGVKTELPKHKKRVKARDEEDQASSRKRGNPKAEMCALQKPEGENQTEEVEQIKKQSFVHGEDDRSDSSGTKPPTPDEDTNKQDVAHSANQGGELATGRKRPKRPKRREKCLPKKVGSQEASLLYLQAYETPEWKFCKKKQHWLVQNAFDENSIGEEDFRLFLHYIEKMRGCARHSLQAAAEDVVNTYSSLKGVAPTERYERARSVLQMLAE